MKAGDLVTIYGKFLTQQEPEGRAKLVQRISFMDNGVERWRVKFEKGDVAERLILTNKGGK